MVILGKLKTKKKIWLDSIQQKITSRGTISSKKSKLEFMTYMIRTPNVLCMIVCERIRVSVYVREDCLRVSERMCECVRKCACKGVRVSL